MLPLLGLEPLLTCSRGKRLYQCQNLKATVGETPFYHRVGCPTSKTTAAAASYNMWYPDRTFNSFSAPKSVG